MLLEFLIVKCVIDGSMLFVTNAYFSILFFEGKLSKLVLNKLNTTDYLNLQTVKIIRFLKHHSLIKKLHDSKWMKVRMDFLSSRVADVCNTHVHSLLDPMDNLRMFGWS